MLELRPLIGVICGMLLIILLCLFSFFPPLKCGLKFLFDQETSKQLPCNPYSLNGTISLQCKVTLILQQQRGPQELNFNTAWMKRSPSKGAKEQEIIYSSENVEISTKQSYFEYSQQTSSVAALSITSLMTLVFDGQADLTGKYWCNVLSNTIEDHSTNVIGNSNPVEIGSKGFYEKYQSIYSPCAKKVGLHLGVMEFEHNGRWTAGSEAMLERFLMLLVLIGGFLTACSCGHLFKKKKSLLHQEKLVVTTSAESSKNVKLNLPSLESCEEEEVLPKCIHSKQQTILPLANTF